MHLLYADDMTEMGDTVSRLQKLLNQLEVFCKRWGLNVNINKSKIMVFRNGGKLRANEKLFYKGNSLEIVPYFKYLGLMITSRLNWSLAQKTLANQAAKSLFVIKKANLASGGLNPDVLLNLFDKLIVPILLYGSEIWGLSTRDCIEKVQLKFLKYVLGVPLSTPNAAVQGEFGRYPVSVLAVMRSVKYWLKVVCMDNSRTPKAALNMLTSLDESSKTNWVSHIKHLLFRHGFGIVYINGNVGDEQGFLSQLKERLIIEAQHNWRVDVNVNGRLKTYSQFKSILEPEKYLTCIDTFAFRQALALFRCSSHSLLIEKGRHLNICKEDRLCSICNVIDDEEHAITKCVKYSSQRKHYVPEIVDNKITFIQLLQSQNISTITNLSKFILVILRLSK